MEISLSEDDAKLLLQSAWENQTWLLQDIEKMKTKDDGVERHEMYHFQAHHARCEDAIQRLSRKLTFPLNS
jgi:hypothetical protein